jgi:DNA-binding response OmpR family regulator
MIRKALVVDDELIILDILGNILERNGYDITRATDGDQAIKALDAEDFDLVITDLQMGQTSGLDVIRKAKNNSRRTIVMMMTGCHKESYAIAAFHHGADDFFHKPFSISDLLERIQLQELKQFHPAALAFEREQQVKKVSG